MKPTNLFTYLSGLPYLGRGIFFGLSPDGNTALIAYFIMGRSENSRNRIFIKTEDGIRTKIVDPSELEDPSLILYVPVRQRESQVIVSNGDQTDTIYEALLLGHSFQDALMTRTYEPDAPHYTPRISGIFTLDKTRPIYHLSILKRGKDEGKQEVCQRNFYEYRAQAGIGHLIHTYQDDRDPLPSFEGEPIPVLVEGSFELFAEQLWKNLNEENKVSLFVESIDLIGGGVKTILFNKRLEVQSKRSHK